jgi:hypothetical protein
VTLADLRQWLQRFRAPPGRPAQALGVPAKENQLEEELEPLLAQLDVIAEEAASMRDDAHRCAQEKLAVAGREASRVLISARERADVERVRAADAWIMSAEAESDTALQDALKEASQIRERGEEGIATVVSSILRCVEEGAR